MQEKNIPKTKKILLALAKHVGVRGIRGLAGYLEVPESNLYSWIARDRIGDKAVILKKIPNVKFDWLESFDGEMLVAEADLPYSVTQVHRNLRPEQEQILKKAEGRDELVQAVLDLEETPELLLILQDMKNMTPEQRWEYAKAGRKAVRKQ